MGDRESVMEAARAVGLVVEPCNNEDFIAVRASKAPPGTQERMRMTADGAVLTVSDGYYWQVGAVSDIENYVKTLQGEST